MEKVQSLDDLMERIGKMTKDNSVCQVFIPGKGKFTIVLQEEDTQSIAVEVQSDDELRQMIEKSIEAYNKGDFMTTSEAIKSLEP